MAKLTPAARRFRGWLIDTFDTQGCDALLEQLVADYDELMRLRERARLAREAGDDALYLRYTAAITKMTASFIRTWKAAGLAGVELPPEVRASAHRR
jgi:hypothetical protein